MTSSAAPRPDGDATPRCLLCDHFFVTWDACAPRGCRAYGFKSREFPSAVVFSTSGEPCRLYAKKERPARP